MNIRCLFARIAIPVFASVLTSCSTLRGAEQDEPKDDGPIVSASWTKNPDLTKATGLWNVRTFCWTIGGDCPDDLELSQAEWVDDGSVFLRAEDDNTDDLGCDCAAMTQGTQFDGSVSGDPLMRIRTGDVVEAKIYLKRSDSHVAPCSGWLNGAGNIINLWLAVPGVDGWTAHWVTDFYFETVGANAGFDERQAPHSELVAEERGYDWYAYQVHLESFPEYWEKTTEPDGTEAWVIDLKALLDRGSAFSGRDLSNYLWYYVDVVSESVCLNGEVGDNYAQQRIHYFDIRVGVRP